MPGEFTTYKPKPRAKHAKPRARVLNQKELARAADISLNVLQKWLKEEGAPVGVKLGVQKLYNVVTALNWALSKKEAWQTKQNKNEGQ